MRPILSLLALALLVACDDNGPAAPEALGAPQFDIFDGSTHGNPDFFWLPPAAPNPDLGGSVFNRDLTPVVDICEGRIAENPAEHDEPHELAQLASHCSDPVVLGAEARRNGNQYRVQWKTPANPPAQVFTAIARIEEVILAHLHIVVAVQGKDAPSIAGDYIVNAGGQAELNFHIGEEALCFELFEGYDAGSGCTSRSLPEFGSLSHGDVLVQLGEDDATITITDACDAEWQLALPQIGTCRFIADASLDDLDDPAVVCLFEGEVGTLLGETVPYHDEARVFQFGVEDGEFFAEALPPANCATVVASAARTNPFARLASAVWDLVGPEPLLASRATVLHHGGGGSVLNFKSNFWVSLPLRIAIDDSWVQDQKAPLGSTLEPKVVVSYFENDAEDYVPYDGFFPVEVTFEASAGNGELQDSEGPASVVSGVVGGDGTVAVDWILPSERGSYEVSAYGLGLGTPNAFGEHFQITEANGAPPVTFRAEALGRRR